MLCHAEMNRYKERWEDIMAPLTRSKHSTMSLLMSIRMKSGRRQKLEQQRKMGGDVAAGGTTGLRTLEQVHTGGGRGGDPGWDRDHGHSPILLHHVSEVSCHHTPLDTSPERRVSNGAEPRSHKPRYLRLT